MNNKNTGPKKQKKVNVFDFLDFRELLKKLYEEKKENNKDFSYRYIASRCGFKSAGFFTNILQGRRNISDNIIFNFARLFKLNKRETEYFELLVHYNQTSQHDQKRFYFEKIISMRKSSVYQITKDKYRYFNNWYNVAIRELLNYYPFDGDYKKLARMISPPIRPEQAQKSVKLLEKLELIRKNEKGIYEVTNKTITSFPHVPLVAVHNFQMQAMDLSKEAIDRFKKDERSISTLTLSLSKETYKTIEERLAAFRRDVLELVKNDKNLIEQVYQFNFQIFPLTKNIDENEKNRGINR